MKDAVQVTWASLRDIYEELFTLVAANLLALLLCIPVVTAPPALAALHNLGFHLATEKRIEIGQFWEGFRAFFVDSWKLAGLNLLVFAILGVDIWFYLGRMRGAWQVLGYVGIWMFLIWAVAQLYTFPLLVRQAERNFGRMLKNAVLLTLAHPIFSLTVAVLLILLLALSVVIPIFFILIGLAFVAVLSAHTLRRGIERVEERRGQEDGQDDI
jgi:uncharacterized membrane protein YesL